MPTIIEETASSWGDLQALLFDSSWNQQLGRFRSPDAYRGLSDSSYALDTTLMRLDGPYHQLERHLLRNFIKYAHRDMVARDSFWHWLSMAQHHGLPTRLLDWTHSPLVAMHFATANTEKYDRDGVIWSINYEQCHTLLPEQMKQSLDSEGANTFTCELLMQAVPSLEQLDRMSNDPFLLFFEPPSMDDRIVNQFALFSVVSNASIGLNSWIEGHGSLCRKIVIPASLKWEVRDKLDQCNVTERVLFPGLDGLTRWLYRHYSPKQWD
ncbi:MAG: FRG domain-containing protein [Candidatus Thiodiazotropha sp. (ex. Lucinisca nassula)]|nr:FRG domain-containing protein [Candidatus Thiodiazotropha sp. (ex. Lucinisca nassula)]